MKDRIRQIMESQHMTQQVFADYIGTTPATLSGIFNDRTRPTINIVESIKKKFPDISLDWLMFGQGDMYAAAAAHQAAAEPTLFDDAAATAQHLAPSQPPLSAFSPTAPSSAASDLHRQPTDLSESVKATLKETLREELKIFDNKKRHVSEIRVYYDDGSYESFLPAK